MKTFFILTFVSFSAIATEFDCRYFYNLEEVYRNKVTINDGQKEMRIAELEEYVFFLSSHPRGKFELQALNRIEPSRTYASAILSSSNPELELVIWKRDGMVEGKCTLQPN